MPNLEELHLTFGDYNERLIDGDVLKNNILHHMTKLNKFIFNIQSVIPLRNKINLPSNEDIQYTLRDFKSNQIISSVDCLPRANEYRCHIYSYPYTLTHYNNITNNFPGGLFRCVNEISLYDERPFEHEFFLQIAQSFPLLEKLTIKNYQPQRNDNQQWAIIEFPYLDELNMVQVHKSYVEQFLNSTKISLLNDFYLYVTYESLQSVTHNFTRDVTRMNCFKVICLLFPHEPESFEYVKDYFPNAGIV